MAQPAQLQPQEQRPAFLSRRNRRMVKTTTATKTNNTMAVPKFILTSPFGGQYAYIFTAPLVRVVASL